MGIIFESTETFKSIFVLNFNNFLGTFTGSSAVAWALALPSDGEVLTIDVNPEYYDMISRNLISARPDISSKIKRHIGPALEKLGKFTLDLLIQFQNFVKLIILIFLYFVPIFF